MATGASASIPSHNHHDVDADTHALVADCGFEPSEHLMLELMRTFCMSFAEPQTLAWDRALERAEFELGEARGAQVACAMARLLRVIRIERQTTFDFINVNCLICCKRIRSTEFTLIQLVRAARTDHADVMKAAALILVQGRSILGLMEAARSLALLLNNFFDEDLALRQKATTPRRNLH